MARLAKLIATVGGLGYAPFAPGTAGSAAGVALALAAARVCTPLGNFLCAVMACAIGTWAAGRVARDLNHPDPSCVVIDETAAMWLVIAGLPAPSPWWILLVAFLGFRLFDVWKPFPLRRLERWPGGLGIMLDDVGAAAYTLLFVQLIAWLSSH